MSGPQHSGHEKTDAKPAPLVWFGFWMVVFILACAAVALWMLRVLESRSADYPGPASVTQKTPAAPLLQTAEWDDLRRMKEESIGTLATYGWEDRQKGIVRIPIDRAIDAMVEKQ